MSEEIFERPRAAFSKSRVKLAPGGSEGASADAQGRPWIAAWRGKMGADQEKIRCANCECSRFAERGVLVKKATRDVNIVLEFKPDESLYIVPLCARCGAPESEEPFRVPDGWLVPVDEKGNK